jgi:NhaP-type Na+/H+ or K+/H+ antiporter
VFEQQVFIGVALIVGIAAACQVIAPKLHVPALLLLLPAGFLAGAFFDAMNPLAILGEAFTPMVNIAVALILFHGGMELFASPLTGRDHVMIRRLVMHGALITWGAAGLAAIVLFDLPVALGFLLGAVVIVSGPTVVGPLLDFVRPSTRLRHILIWEGTLIDPVGAIIAVIFFQGIQASDTADLASALVSFFTSIGVGLLAGLLGLGLIWVGLVLAGSSRLLGTQVLFGAVIVAASVADAVEDDSGLIAAVIMGLATPLLVRRHLEEHFTSIMPFFEVVVGISIGVLFVSISALVSPESLRGLILPSAVMVAFLVLILRPLSALLLTRGTTLTRRERLFIGWMAPRGIVAAAAAAGFSSALISEGVPGGEKLLPATFLIIAGTVAVYSLTAVPMARLLKVRQSPEPAASTEARAQDSPATVTPAAPQGGATEAKERTDE